MTGRASHIVLAAAAAFIVAGTAGCFGRHHVNDAADPDKVARHLDHALDHLDATAEQRRELMPVGLEIAAELSAMRAKALRLRADAMAQWDATTPDAAELHRRVDQEVDALRQNLHRLVDQVIVVHDALTPEQRQQVADRW